MKRRDLERHLRTHGCRQIDEGGNHSRWAAPEQWRELGVAQTTRSRRRRSCWREHDAPNGSEKDGAPVIRRPISSHYEEMLTLAGLIDPSASAWIRSVSRVEQLVPYRRPPALSMTLSGRIIGGDGAGHA